MRRIDPRIWQVLLNHHGISGWPMGELNNVEGHRTQVINGERKEFRLEDGRWVEVETSVDINEELKELQGAVEELYDSIEDPSEEQVEMYDEAVGDIARLVDETS